MRYDGVLSSNLLLEGFWARALNDINEVPSVNTWRVTDRTVTPNAISGGIGFYEAGNHSLNNQFAVKATNVIGNHQVKYGVQFDDVDYSNINQRTGPTFTAPDGRADRDRRDHRRHRRSDVREDLPRDARELQQRPRPRRRNTSRSSCRTRGGVDRLTINPGIRYEQEKLAGSIIDGLPAEEQLGAAHRRDLRPDGRRQDEGVRQLRPLLLAHPERPGGARAVGRRRHSARRLLRRGPDPADSRTASRWRRGGADDATTTCCRASAPT